jgi:hypothetical protein
MKIFRTGVKAARSPDRIRVGGHGNPVEAATVIEINSTLLS